MKAYLCSHNADINTVYLYKNHEIFQRTRQLQTCLSSSRNCFSLSNVGGVMYVWRGSRRDSVYGSCGHDSSSLTSIPGLLPVLMCMVYTVYIFYNVQCILYSVYCIVYSVYYIYIYIIPKTKKFGCVG